MNINIAKTKMDMVMEIINLVTVIGTIVYLVLNWAGIPNEIPMHYDALGQVDRWGSKDEIILLVVIMVMSYVIITFVEHFPQMWNTGVKVTEENSTRVYRVLKNMISIMKLTVIIGLAVLIVTSARAMALPVWYTAVFMALMFGNIIFWIVRLNQVK